MNNETSNYLDTERQPFTKNAKKNRFSYGKIELSVVHLKKIELLAHFFSSL